MRKLNFPEKIDCNRICLKKYDINLADKMFEYVEKDRERLSEFLPWVDSTNNVKDEKNFIKMSNNAWDDFFLFDYALFLKSNNDYIGNIGIHSINWECSRAEIGYWILSDFESNGFISEALIFIEKVLFGSGFNKIEIRCDSNNQKSSSVPKRNNYKLDGVLRENAFYKNKFVNTMVFSKLKNEYFQNRKYEINYILDRFFTRIPFEEEYYFIEIIRKNKSIFTFFNMENKPQKFPSIKKWFEEKPDSIEYKLIFRKDTKEPIGGIEKDYNNPENLGFEILNCYKNVIKKVSGVEV
ncbi:MAG: GNAT family N-acetyltransferase [Candidatus Muirbacterium halophilum]|nr:GNAT family N-acetyltransferase [Candidatus Muirbacterium halophilum]MCK9476712.1 GNAT family N-acetyltransferase [Candidatus Muirbacterium halophilum]